MTGKEFFDADSQSREGDPRREAMPRLSDIDDELLFFSGAVKDNDLELARERLKELRAGSTLSMTTSASATKTAIARTSRELPVHLLEAAGLEGARRLIAARGEVDRRFRLRCWQSPHVQGLPPRQLGTLALPVAPVGELALRDQRRDRQLRAGRRVRFYA